MVFISISLSLSCSLSPILKGPPGCEATNGGGSSEISLQISWQSIKIKYHFRMFPQPRGDINIYISRREILLIFDCYSCWKYFSFQFYHCYIVTVQMVAVHIRSLFVYPALTLRNWIDSREMWNFNRISLSDKLNTIFPFDNWSAAVGVSLGWSGERRLQR